MNHRLSIIVPTLDEAGNLPALLGDLAPARRRGHEVIVSDGGSSDDTRAIAEPLADHVIAAPRGRARQMNAAAAIASGDVYWFVHADSRLPPDCDLAIAGALDRGASWGRFDIRLSGGRAMFRVVERLINLRSRLSGIATGDQGIFVGRQAFSQVGGYPDIALMEDVALSQALRRLARPACLAQRLVTSSRRWETRGTWPTIVLMWRLRLAYALGADPQQLAERYR
jgi:rSAM/selenodomain-associated transferase 2